MNRRFWNEKQRLYRESRHQRVMRKRFVPVPGCLPDTNSRGQPGRFEKWLKLPQAAHRLYWRFHKKFDLDDVSRCTSGDQIARMLYVGVSRARDQVFLTGDLA